MGRKGESVKDRIRLEERKRKRKELWVGALVVLVPHKFNGKSLERGKKSIVHFLPALSNPRYLMALE